MGKKRRKETNKIYANALLSDGELLAFCTCRKWMSPSDFAPQLRRAGIDLRSYAGTHTLLVETVSRDNTVYSEEAFETGLAYDWYEQFSISPDYRGERPWEAKKEE